LLPSLCFQAFASKPTACKPLLFHILYLYRYDAVAREAGRQVAATCNERGQLLEKIRGGALQVESS
jgi:hypothetical protein